MEHIVENCEIDVIEPVLLEWLQSNELVRGWQRANIANALDLSKVSPALYNALNPVAEHGYVPTYKDLLSAIVWQKRPVDLSVRQALSAGLQLHADEAKELVSIYGCTKNDLLEKATVQQEINGHKK